MIGGRDVTSVPPRVTIAMVFQSYALYPTMTVAENIAFGMKVRRVPREEQEKKVEEVSRLLQINHLLELGPRRSGRPAPCVAMGRALVRGHVFLSTAAQQSRRQAASRCAAINLHERLNASIVYVTHDQIEAMTLGSRIVVLNRGTIQQVGTPEEIYERPDNMFVADFMGSPPMNLVPATYTTEKGTGTIGFNGHLARLPVTAAGLKEGAVVVGIRPEAFIAAAPGAGMLTLTAMSIENAGSDTFVTFELSGKPVVARLPGRMHVHAGDSVSLDIDLPTLCFFDPETEQRIR